ncbi:type II secretion system F family protein [Desulfonatronovibrio hydrogenovorans]|uniref:type II secretion system F family protein n=1 Tax=Desulfonatronovibrio hydrogenovorans TaxID=53245 RepID=UPI000491B19B|nr:type II secretion system F family protein [Desulfonatronovibrio hydrogenovorans]
MDYSYQAINQAGKKVAGVIQARSSDEAMERVARQNLIPVKVRPASRAGLAALTKGLGQTLVRVNIAELILFTKQFRTLFKAGLPMSSLWGVMGEQTENVKLRRAAEQIATDIDSGLTLYESFRKHPNVFSPLYCSMVHAGETSGRLPEVFDRLVYLLQHEHKVRSDIKSALRYPLIVVMALTGAFFFLLGFVMPQFVQAFVSAGIELPLPTRITISLHEWLIVYWPVSLSAFLFSALCLILYVRTPTGRLHKDRLLLKLPVLGPVLIKGAMARFASIFSILQASGISVINTLSILSRTIGNEAISREFDRLQVQLREGRGIAGPLKSARYFTPMVINMVAVGEEGGNLDEMLHDISVHYDDEVAYMVNRMSEILGPVLMVALAGVVGFFALAIFMPMWDLVQMV